jgi:hypothetical protein
VLASKRANTLVNRERRESLLSAFCINAWVFNLNVKCLDAVATDGLLRMPRADSCCACGYTSSQ